MSQRLTSDIVLRRAYSPLWKMALRCTLPDYMVPVPVKRAYLTSLISMIRVALISRFSIREEITALLPIIKHVCNFLKYDICENLVKKAEEVFGEIEKSLTTDLRLTPKDFEEAEATTSFIDPRMQLTKAFDALVEEGQKLPPTDAVHWLTVVVIAFLSVFALPPPDIEEIAVEFTEVTEL